MALICSSLKPLAFNWASVMSPVNCLRVSVRTSEVSQDCSPGFAMIDSRNDCPSIETFFIGPLRETAPSLSLPMLEAVVARARWKAEPPMPALTTEFQSCRPTLPEAMAWESWYIAVEAWSAFEPDSAARLAMPLIEAVDVFRSTPAAVNVPMFRAIWLKL